MSVINVILFLDKQSSVCRSEFRNCTCLAKKNIQPQIFFLEGKYSEVHGTNVCDTIKANLG